MCKDGYMLTPKEDGHLSCQECACPLSVPSNKYVFDLKSRVFPVTMILSCHTLSPVMYELDTNESHLSCVSAGGLGRGRRAV